VPEADDEVRAPSPAVVEALLTKLWHAPVAIERWERQKPWSVARVHLKGAAAPPTAVVKWMRGYSDLGRTESWRLRLEPAALRFLADDLGLSLAPRVLAADLDAGFFVLEDLAPRVALDRLIRRDGFDAHIDRLIAFARLLGELGAATSGAVAALGARPDTLARLVSAADPLAAFPAELDEACRHAAALGTPVTSAASRELVAVVDELRAPGPFLSLTNGDAESNNVLVHASGPADARLIDFESTAFTHALLSAVCLYVPGPGWLSVGDPVATGLADHYRRALAGGVPEAQDDRRYGYGLAAACVWWAMRRLQRFGKLDGRGPGDKSRLQLVETLEAAARTANAYRALPHLAGWLCATAERLRHRWPDADLDFTDPDAFPPYSPRH